MSVVMNEGCRQPPDARLAFLLEHLRQALRILAPQIVLEGIEQQEPTL